MEEPDPHPPLLGLGEPAAVQLLVHDRRQHLDERLHRRAAGATQGAILVAVQRALVVLAQPNTQALRAVAAVFANLVHRRLPRLGSRIDIEPLPVGDLIRREQPTPQVRRVSGGGQR